MTRNDDLVSWMTRLDAGEVISRIAATRRSLISMSSNAMSTIFNNHAIDLLPNDFYFAGLLSR